MLGHDVLLLRLCHDLYIYTKYQVIDGQKINKLLVLNVQKDDRN